MSTNSVIQSPEDQFLHWCQDMERKQEEQARQIKEFELMTNDCSRRTTICVPRWIKAVILETKCWIAVDLHIQSLAIKGRNLSSLPMSIPRI